MEYYIRFLGKDKQMHFYCIPGEVAQKCEIAKEEYDAKTRDMRKAADWVQHPNTGEVCQT